MDQMPNQVSADTMRAFAGDHQLHCTKSEPPTVRSVILLASQKSGSTWMQRRLGTHSQLHLEGELFLALSRECDASPHGCPWKTYADRLDYELERMQRNAQHTRVTVVGFKLMYNHIPERYRRHFADFCHCRSVAILHLMRTASVESFWTLQAQILDAVDMGEDYRDRFSSGDKQSVAKLSSNRVAFNLPPEPARQYVAGLESMRRSFRMLLMHHAHHVDYAELVYEQVRPDTMTIQDTQAVADATAAFATGSPEHTAALRAVRERQQHLQSATRYWNAALAFLNLPSEPLRDTLERVHPGTCRSKMANWEDVKDALFGLESFWACVW